MQSSPFEVILKLGELELVQKKEIKFTDRKSTRMFSYANAGLSIAKKTFQSEKPSEGKESEIIKKIHQVRFNSSNHYVITGGHFHQLYVRNLGIFYNALLDPRTSLSPRDWTNRQTIVLKTVALDLKIFDLAKKEYTTIVPLRGSNYTCLNMYARPSDSLYAILYSLVALTDSLYIQNLFPIPSCKAPKLQTKKTGLKLLKDNKLLLQALLKQYYDEIIDKQNGLIRKEILLSSARDGIKRESSFYDNVIAWSTAVLAKKLNIYEITNIKIEKWKENILKTFWNEQEGIFIDDLSVESIKNKKFCADSFIVVSSGFLKPTVSKEKHYLLGMIEYVRKHKLDMPFPLHYAKNDDTKKLYKPVKYFAKSYMGKSIWSHWGMEYIKSLILLSNDNPDYLQIAKKHLNLYEKNIEKYGGYPELYKPDGDIFSSRFYKSVLHNGWVVNYEQATKMLYSIM